ncbi:MAG: hypothetical protein ACT6FD_05990 [Methanosarcinaceae archaeon]
MVSIKSRCTASIAIHFKKKVIELKMNTKEPELMRKLNKDLCVLTNMDVNSMDGQAVQFKG